METSRRIEPAAWMIAAETAALLAALRTGGATVRFVGGCVRDTILGLRAKDIDVATPEPPDIVLRRLQESGIRAIPTGIEHGTVTAVIDGKHFEVTTLRRDVETYGRRAKVAFTDDWVADARRRDLTINALYADETGAIFDPTGGLADLAAGRVRFVGAAAERIDEDALRILRFFRFHARFARGEPDSEALAACRDKAAALATLSGERIAGELLRLLALDDPLRSIDPMLAHRILAPVLPAIGDRDRLARLLALERPRGACDPVRRLAALLPPDPAAAVEVAERLRLSRDESVRLGALAARARRIGATPSTHDLRLLLFQLGRPSTRDLLYLAAADGTLDDDGVIDRLEQLTTPAFPLKGRDALALGIAPGPRVGEMLAVVQDWWIAGDFRADRAACLEKLREMAVSGT